MMLSALDVHYLNDEAKTACICFDNWSDSNSSRDFVETIQNAAPYESGKFYKRELPCILSILNTYDLQPEIIIVDGYAWLDENIIGLGGHLFNELGGTIPVIGVAKRKFKTHSKVKEVFRGNSRNPLYISSIGIDLDEAAKNIEMMDGSFRIPTLLKRVDQLSRGIDTI